MRYLFINSVYGVGSTGRIVAEKCRQLRSEGHECAAAYGRACADNGAAQLIRIGTKADYLVHAGIVRLLDLNGYGSGAATGGCFGKWSVFGRTWSGCTICTDII